MTGNHLYVDHIPLESSLCSLFSGISECQRATVSRVPAGRVRGSPVRSRIPTMRLRGTG